MLDAIKNPELGKNRLKGAVNKVVKAKKTAAVAGDFMSQMRDKMEARRSVGTERSRFARAPRIATTAGTKQRRMGRRWRVVGKQRHGTASRQMTARSLAQTPPPLRRPKLA